MTCTSCWMLQGIPGRRKWLISQISVNPEGNPMTNENITLPLLPLFRGGAARMVFTMALESDEARAS